MELDIDFTIKHIEYLRYKEKYYKEEEKPSYNNKKINTNYINF